MQQRLYQQTVSFYTYIDKRKKHPRLFEQELFDYQTHWIVFVNKCFLERCMHMTLYLLWDLLIYAHICP